jgi:hypothetical protein
MIFEMMACALKKCTAKGKSMKKLKQILEKIFTGGINKLGLPGIFSGNYQMAVIYLKK